MARIVGKALTHGPEAAPSTPKPSSVGGPLSPEAQRFFQDLSNYIPVGCLSAPKESSAGEDTKRGVWKEISDIATLLGHRHCLQDVQKLIAHGWVRIFSTLNESARIFRIYVLPRDVGHRYVDHSQKALSKALRTLVKELDVSPETWNGSSKSERPTAFDTSATLDKGSLYWMFNTLPSPAPSVERIRSYFHRRALRVLLNPECQLPGLLTRLYPYQRRSAGLMLHRESEVKRELDPRLERRTAPDGSMYFYGPRSTAFLQSPKLYETSKGGVLAET